jgi:alpha-N-arabinofuranosidase
MRIPLILALVLAPVIAFSPVGARGDAITATLNVDVSKPGVVIPPDFGGLMTEEINHTYDGGLYAELVRNRAFLDNADEPQHWSLMQAPTGSATMELDRTNPVNDALPASLHVTLTGGEAGVSNQGYWGIPVKPDTTYTASFYARGGDGFSGPISASIISNQVDATAQSTPITDSWQKYTVKLTTGHDVHPTAHGRFVVSANGKGSLWLSLVSLFPPTYKDAPNGLRPDLMQLLADLHPAFIRLPGGNYLEGNDFPNRYNWKKMIGPIDQRPGHQCCWGYRSTDGFGFPEELLWCRQLNAQPVLAVFAGFTLNHDHVVAGPELQKYVDEALEEIEYVSGSADTTWGKQRVADGLAEPFKLQYVEIGNEDFFDNSGSYEGRFAQFYDAIKAKYPNLKVIATRQVNSRQPDLVDDHYYLSPHDMVSTRNRYDNHPRSGPQVFVGEWAAQEGKPTPDLRSGLADAAWVMGLEQDADVIPMECYAPLFVNVNPGAWQWSTNLIGYNSLTSFGSPSYYTQSMLAQNRGDVVLPATVNVSDAPAAQAGPAPHGAVGFGAWHTDAEYKDISITQDEKTLLAPDLTNFDGKAFNSIGGDWTVQGGSLKPANVDAETWTFTGDPSWTDYTIKLKARKNGGAEGFLIIYHAADSDNYHWWNIGGWGNSHTQAEVAHEGARGPFGPSSNFTVDSNRWYDLRLEVRGDHMRGFIDNQLVTDATDEGPKPTERVIATASYAKDSHEVIVKVINLASDPTDATINLTGTGSIKPDGRAIVISGSPKDTNSVAEPTKIAPKQEPVSGVASSFHHTFPANSLTILRLGAEAAN